MTNENQLICVFGKSKHTVKVIQDINRFYDVSSVKILIFESVETPEDIYFVFNAKQVDNNVTGLNSALIHKKKTTNTYYTINALNQLIGELNDGVIDTSYRIPWEAYSNMIILTNNVGVSPRKINLKLRESVLS